MDPAIPRLFHPDLPPACRQVVLVLANHPSSSTATLWLLNRQGEEWTSQQTAVPVSLGRNGLAWGLGEHQAPAPADMAEKREGDGCSPAGIFRIGPAFGYAPAAPAIRLPYQPLTPSTIAIDDPASTHYNRIVDAQRAACDWKSREMMLRQDGLYLQGAVIGHNPHNVPGAGSCIFLHLWRSPGHPTAGCTAMAGEDLRNLLEWLDPAAEPRLVQSPLPP